MKVLTRSSQESTTPRAVGNGTMFTLRYLTAFGSLVLVLAPAAAAGPADAPRPGRHALSAEQAMRAAEQQGRVLYLRQDIEPISKRRYYVITLWDGVKDRVTDLFVDAHSGTTFHTIEYPVEHPTMVLPSEDPSR